MVKRKTVAERRAQAERERDERILANSDRLGDLGEQLLLLRSMMDEVARRQAELKAKQN